MKDMSVNSKVLNEIIKLMDEKEGDKLKMHPKLVAMKVTTTKPLLGSKEDKKEDKMEMESPEIEGMEEKAGSDLDELSPEMLAKIMKMMK